MHANRAPSYLRLFVVLRRCDASKLVADGSEDEVLPDAIGDAFAKAEDPLSAGEVEGVFPYGATDTLVDFTATLNKGARFIDLQVSPNELVRRTGACGRDRREDDELVDKVDMERQTDERNGGAFHWDPAVPQEISVVEEGVEMFRV